MIEYTGDEEYGDVISIDLGESYSRVGVFINKTFQIITDGQGRSAIPNYVEFPSHGSPLVGFEAKERALSNPQKTIYDSRRLIGRNFDDPEIQEAIKELRYDVVDVNGSPVIKIGTESDYIGYTPENITSFILKKLKDMAEVQLKTTIKHATINVPSDFDEYQIQATKDAAEASELNVIRIFPVAKSIAHAYKLERNLCDENGRRANCTYILYDIREGESELTILESDYGVVDVIETVRDRQLRWSDFEAPVGVAQVQLKLPSKQRSERVFGIVEELLIEANIKKDDINGIVVTGDPSHISKVQGVLEAYFPGRKVFTPSGFEHDEAIVFGGALLGHELTEDLCPGCGPPISVNPLGLGIETRSGGFLRVMRRTTVLPSRKTLSVSTSVDNQEEVIIKVLEGEREVAGKNRLLGTLQVSGIPRAPKGVPEIEVVFEVDYEVLKATAGLKGAMEVAKIEVSIVSDRYTYEVIEDIIREGKDNYYEDLQQLMEGSENVLNGVD
ncbi:hypothetical protein V494_08155 [Pseudogymnoascus sp. VKM F-4513 (FW-928)]|nr:hypothetical protein V494_08155 [Pseudogymnoascus sp. VKM F-4513 (FW-928)]